MKVHRLLSIVMHLLNRKRMSGQELADLFEVSLRTIYRDLETINSAGIPIISYSGANGGYEIMDPYHIDRQIVTFEDLHSILNALKGIQSSLDDPDLAELITKVGALMTKSEQSRLEDSGETILFDTNLWRGGHVDRTMIAELRQAARNRFVVLFKYTNSEGMGELRTVEPIGLAWKGYAWYLYAYCRLRNDYRTFRLSRMKELLVSDERFIRRDMSLEDLDARWGKQDIDNQIKMVLRFHPRAKVKVEEYFPPEEITIAEDGYFIVRTEHSLCSGGDSKVRPVGVRIPPLGTKCHAKVPSVRKPGAISCFNDASVKERRIFRVNSDSFWYSVIKL
ncbi:YafY family transcriptional regulator [Cohnella xylanilytica]|uniref:YafY family transcriptional regulator n=1 Tax=Cohnella xylanilytica TaxID=557555 RepID=A0A841TSI9_9BACL|nr:YafY family protein [Cohnella xylanilytica]MBB6691397.1 YafY family transcriptional regulator [Cohnella xylanilytica]